MKFLSGILFMLVWCYADAQNILDKLPEISDQFIYHQQANYDRAGLNADGFVSRTIFDTIPHGLVNNPNGTALGGNEYVLANITGPAKLQRFWIAGVQNNDVLRFYFDGETAPRLEKTIFQLFYEQQSPFKMPLVDNLLTSSGCFIMYFPMNIAQNLIITLDSNFVFHQTGYQQLPADTVIQSWTPADLNSDLAALFSVAGSYPKSNAAQLVKDSSVVTLNPHETKTIFTKNSPGSVESIEMDLPALDFTYSERIHDTGNYRKGTAAFKMAIDKTADSVILINRCNKNPYFNGSLPANMWVRINGTLAGVWTASAYRDHHFWENDRFSIPKSLYQNKDTLTISIQHINNRNWNEFYYWIECDGVITDELDIRDSLSEAQHEYVTNSLVNDVNQDITARYRAPENIKTANHAILDSVYIRIFFDDEVTPSVDAPAGLFFGTGSNDAAFMNSLLCGNVSGTFYNYFSMPFWSNARVELENKSSALIAGNTVRIRTVSSPGDQKLRGYFKTLFRRETKYSNDKTDYHFLSATGKGKFCGIVIEGNMNSVPVGPLAWLEGDERIYIDDAKTPFIHGTGTEDFFNGGFYFVLDEYSKPQHGMTNSDVNYHRSMYRFFHTDPIYFYKNIYAGVEHGGANDTLGNYSSLAFYYLKPDTAYKLTDSLDIGNAASEQRHQYQYSGNTSIISKTSAFEGEKFTQQLTHDGVSFDDYSEFNVRINKYNTGVRLLRTYDYSYKNQKASVYVNDTFAGKWSYVGNNTISQFRDDYFTIPAKFTKGRDSLRIKIYNEGMIWTELYYKVYSVFDPASVPTNTASSVAKNNILVYPNPSSTQIFIHLPQIFENTVLLVFNSTGSLQLAQSLITVNSRISVHELPAGTYFYRVQRENSILHTGKFIRME